MRTVVFASSNAGKLRELQALLGEGWLVKSAQDFPEIPEVDEDADTFEGNAAKKARTFAKATGLWALADDSGLVVDALGGRPGVYSARYAPTEPERIEKLLAELKDVPPAKRTARFVCVLCLASPSGEERFTRGTCEGVIGLTRKGTHGFGYDPVFELPNGKTMSELTRDEKSALSHRGHAVRAMLPQLIAAGA
ncbi:MAG: RdgB/HAM1 family non-canonical purine NTP pyrophosphatase [Archangium sp.]|nr:RdgB/HAM1 family non-canonical purine NTP pyrophosphatase [Archangium sp.]MDP3152502.1 RdgB/HAM1 family non-canonical purine NTP pyrophosphatase [Archangium sp.]MDP3572328.1 RdgB/HAM1 family non-canonical purine NTP pyrophosphatase [Archangium sp.]